MEIKDFTRCLLNDRIILFSVDSYTNNLTLFILDHLYQNGLLNDGKLPKQTKYLNYILKETIDDDFLDLQEVVKKTNFKLYFFDLDVDIGDYSEYIEDSTFFVKKVKRYIKKYMCSGKKIPILSKNIFSNQYLYDDMECILLNGEDREYLLKKLKKYE